MAGQTTSLFLIAILLSMLGIAWAGYDAETTDFLSRPDIIAPKLRIAYIDKDLVAPGFLFLAPSNPDGSNFTSTMYIYNAAGHLVWSGQEFNDPGHTHNNFHVCQYREQPHLCVTMFEGPRGGGRAKDSYSLIIDQEYSIAQAVAPKARYDGAPLKQDLHEFRVVPPGLSAVGTCHAIVQREVSLPACGDTGVKYVRTGIFTETLLDGTNKTIFQWDALDHVDIADSYLCPGEGGKGSGATKDEAFDFFHINSVDKDANGDYLVSARHTSIVYKIAGLDAPEGVEPGTVIWKLRGDRGTFMPMDSTYSYEASFNFSSQHDARFREGGISLWNNANDGVTGASALSSSGMDININEENNTTALVYQAFPPKNKLDVSQGNHQLLPNGNHFCDMGSVNEMYERTPGGQLALDAFFSHPPTQSYRAFKFPWVARPPTANLRFFTYAHDCSGTQTTYVSWNGATADIKYQVRASDSIHGDYRTVATESTGTEFETAISYATYYEYSYVAAFDLVGNLIAKTEPIRTFVPGKHLRERCDEFRCPPRTDYDVSSRLICQRE